MRITKFQLATDKTIRASRFEIGSKHRAGAGKGWAVVRSAMVVSIYKYTSVYKYAPEL